MHATPSCMYVYLVSEIHDFTKNVASWNVFPCIRYLVIMETSIFLLNISKQCCCQFEITTLEATNYLTCF
jgi:hypothetical protein